MNINSQEMLWRKSYTMEFVIAGSVILVAILMIRAVIKRVFD